jgi:hypothetical protein
MSAVGLAELADRAHMEPGGWSVGLVEESQIGATTRDLEEELTVLLDAEGSGSVRTFSGRDPELLIEELAGLGAEDIVLLPLPAAMVLTVSRALDYGRTRLVGGPRGVILTSEAGLRELAAEAPNFWSWVSSRVWIVEPLAGQLDSEARLSSLRHGTGLSDAEVLQRAEAGTLAPDPVFAEWLVLLGRGDLLGR